MRDALLLSERFSFKEIRPLNIPEGSKSERLRVVGWVQDDVGRVSIAAESICPPAEPNNQGTGVTAVESGTGPKQLRPGFLFLPCLPVDADKTRVQSKRPA